MRTEHLYYRDKLRSSLGSNISSSFDMAFTVYNNTKYNRGNTMLTDLNNWSVLIPASFYVSNNKYDNNSNILPETHNIINIYMSKIAQQANMTNHCAPYSSSEMSSLIADQLSDFLMFYWKINNVVDLKLRAKLYGTIWDYPGWIFINPWTMRMETLLPWQVKILPSEYHYNRGRFTKAIIKYPMLDSLTFREMFKQEYQPGIFAQDVELYFDQQAGTCELYINNQHQPTATIQYKGRPPVIPFFFEKPTVGLYYVGGVSRILNIQKMINLYAGRNAKSAQMSIWKKFFKSPSTELPEFSDKIGEFIDMVPGENQPPIMAFDPPAVNTQNMQDMQLWRELAYSQFGLDIRQSTGADSTAPGASGIAKQTAENLQMGRFTIDLNDFRRVDNEIVDIMFDVVSSAQLNGFDISKFLMPENTIYRSQITWEQALRYRNQFEFIYENTLLETNDPDTYLQRIQAMKQLGIITPRQLREGIPIPNVKKMDDETASTENRFGLFIDNFVESQGQMQQSEEFQLMLRFINYEVFFEQALIKYNLCIKSNQYQQANLINQLMQIVLDIGIQDGKFADQYNNIIMGLLPPAKEQPIEVDSPNAPEKPEPQKQESETPGGQNQIQTENQINPGELP